MQQPVEDLDLPEVSDAPFAQPFQSKQLYTFKEKLMSQVDSELDALQAFLSPCPAESVEPWTFESVIAQIGKQQEIEVDQVKVVKAPKIATEKGLVDQFKRKLKR